MASSPVPTLTAVERHTFVCAWCNALLRSSPDPRCETINYGICPRCLEAQLRALTPVNGVQGRERVGDGEKRARPTRAATSSCGPDTPTRPAAAARSTPSSSRH